MVVLVLRSQMFEDKPCPNRIHYYFNFRQNFFVLSKQRGGVIPLTHILRLLRSNIHDTDY